MRIRSNDVSMHKSRPFASAAVGNSLFKYSKTLDRVGAIDFGKIEVWKVGDQLRDVATGCVYLYGRRNRILVVLDDEQHRKLLVGRSIQRLPEFALAGRAFAQGCVHDLITVEGDILEGAIVIFVFPGRFRMMREVASSLGATDGMQHLG